MTKIINAPKDYVNQSLEGLSLAYPDIVLTGPGDRVVRRRGGVASGKVGIVSGGGAGHLPLFCGYVGKGLIDTCAVGNVFEGPTLDACMAAARLAENGAGILQLIGNYGGERMNFAAVRETLEDEGIKVETVLGTDDIASASPEDSDRRRGVAGLIFAYKAAGARAAEGGSLEDVKNIAVKAVARTKTIGFGTAGCQIPGSDTPRFVLEKHQMEMGIGIHGEPGIWRDQLRSADAIAEEMVTRLLAERPLDAGDKVAILVNSLGATPLEELFILFRRATTILEKNGLRVVRPLVGHFVTSMEMAGASISLSFIDDELDALYAAPARSPAWTVAP